MHEVLDTETVDAADELFWPKKFKQILRIEVKPIILQWLGRQKIFNKIFEHKAKEEYDIFLERLAEKIVIGAENGSDDAFEAVHRAFSRGSALPCVIELAESMLGNEVFSIKVRQSIKASILVEYSNEHLYEHVYLDFYQGTYQTLDTFLKAVSERALAGVVNGAENMLKKIFKSYIYNIPLPPARRHPRYIKDF